MSNVDVFVNLSSRLGSMKKTLSEESASVQEQWEPRFQELVQVLFKIEHEYGAQRTWNQEHMNTLESGLVKFETRNQLHQQAKRSSHILFQHLKTRLSKFKRTV